MIGTGESLISKRWSGNPGAVDPSSSENEGHDLRDILHHGRTDHPRYLCSVVCLRPPVSLHIAY